jgi:hypothetical protein
MAHFPDQTKVFHRYANTPPERHFTTASKKQKKSRPRSLPRSRAVQSIGIATNSFAGVAILSWLAPPHSISLSA